MKHSIIALLIAVFSVFLYQKADANPGSSQNSTEVEFYTASFCDDCKEVKQILKQYKPKNCKAYNTTNNDAYRNEMTIKANNASAPQVFIDGELIGGLEEVKALHESGALKKMLEQ